MKTNDLKTNSIFLKKKKIQKTNLWKSPNQTFGTIITQTIVCSQYKRMRAGRKRTWTTRIDVFFGQKHAELSVEIDTIHGVLLHVARRLKHVAFAGAYIVLKDLWCETALVVGAVRHHQHVVFSRRRILRIFVQNL